MSDEIHKIPLVQINDLQVKPIPKQKVNLLPIKGAKVCSTCHSNIMCVAPTAGGKTTTIFKMIKECSGKKTIVVAFVSTIYNDENWIAIRDWCERKKIQFHGYTSLKEDGKNILGDYVQYLTKEAEERESKRRRAKEMDQDEVDEGELYFDPEKPERRERKERFQYPRFIFVFDDLSDEIRGISYETLLKRARHYEIMTITASQDLKDMKPATRNQIRQWLLFPNLSEERLESIYETIAPKFPLQQFETMYKYATKQPYNFLYIAPRDQDYRMNFNKQFKISKQ